MCRNATTITVVDGIDDLLPCHRRTTAQVFGDIQVARGSDHGDRIEIDVVARVRVRARGRDADGVREHCADRHAAADARGKGQPTRLAAVDSRTRPRNRVRTRDDVPIGHAPHGLNRHPARKNIGNDDIVGNAAEVVAVVDVVLDTAIRRNGLPSVLVYRQVNPHSQDSADVCRVVVAIVRLAISCGDIHSVGEQSSGC